jgi:hypothetical protein
MPGFVMAHGFCFGCGRAFSFNPMRVPSIRPTPDLPREPVCRACVDLANMRRRDTGLPLIVPHPEAYEPCAEVDLHD